MHFSFFTHKSWYLWVLIISIRSLVESKYEDSARWWIQLTSFPLLFSCDHIDKKKRLHGSSKFWWPNGLIKVGSICAMRTVNFHPNPKSFAEFMSRIVDRFIENLAAESLTDERLKMKTLQSFVLSWWSNLYCPEGVCETSRSINKIRPRNTFFFFFIYKPTDGLLPFTYC